MVATKKGPHLEGNFERDVRRGGGSSGVVDTRTVPANPREELGGFIFMCSNETMDLDRHLFGLPQRYQDVVRAIQPGLPLFLYNYSTRKLHGVYEASSNGALNIEPDAWAAESKDLSRNVRPGSKYPAQVRMRLREQRPPLDEEAFRPVLRHYEYSKFKLDLTNEEVKLDLSRDEAEALLRLFGLLDDKGGWQTVPTKSNKVNRGHHVPNSPAGIRRRIAPLANGTTTNGTPALTTLNMLATEASARGREREGRVDSCAKWMRRDDSDSCSGSSSVGTVSSWMGHEEDKPKKVYIANGIHADANGSGIEDKPQDAKFKKMEHPNGNSEVNHSGDVGPSCTDMSHSNGSGAGSEANSMMSHSRGNGRAGFVSYSAALKAGMSPASLETSGGEVQSGYGPDGGTVLAASRLESLKPIPDLTTDVSLADSITDKSKLKSPAASRSPKAEPQSMWVAHPKLKVDALQTPSKRGGLEDVSRLPSALPLAEDKQSASEGDAKRGDRLQPWSKPGALPKSLFPDSARNGSVGGADDPQRLGEVIVDEASGSVERGSLLVEGDVELHHSKSADKKSAWQGNDAAVLRRLHDSDPAVSSTSLNGSLRSTAEVLKEKMDSVTKDVPVQAAESDEPLSGHEIATPKVQQIQHDQNQVPPTSSHNAKIHPQFQHSRSVHEPRRSQFEYQKHDRHVEDRQPHYRKQPLPAELQQHSVPMANARQSLATMRVPTSPPPPNMHHVLPPPTSSSLYRERRVRAGNGTGDGLQGSLTYRPINRNAIESELGLQSPLANGWAYQSPVVLASPPYTPLPGYPPGIYVHQQQLVFPPPHPNVDALHAEVLEFARSVGPSPEARRRAEAAVDCVRRNVKKLWEGADVEVYGSFATGLCISHSDVDVAVVNAPPPSTDILEGGQQLGPVAALTELLFKALNNNEEEVFASVALIPAAIPVVKLRCTPDGVTDKGTPVSIDVTIGTGRKQNPSGGLSPAENSTINYHNGQAAREWVIERLRQLPALAPLVLLLKSFLHQRSLNDVYSGGLGSFSLTLMLVFYLEWAPIWGLPQETPLARSLCSANASVDTTRSTSSRDETDEADDDSSISSYCSTNTSASSLSNESTTMSGTSATSSRTLDGSGPDAAVGNCSHVSRENRPSRAAAIAEELLNAMEAVPAPGLGVLLLGFLRWFESTDFSRVQLMLKGKNGQGGYLPVKEVVRGRCILLWIDDPLRPGNNIGAGSFQMYEVQRALKEMLSILSQIPLVPIFSPSERVGMGPGRRRPLYFLDQLFSRGALSS